MSECGSDFSRGCFKGISSCAMGMGAATTASSGGGSASASNGSSSGSSSAGGNIIPQQHDRDPSQQQFTSAQAGGYPAVQAPEISGSGTLSPTLPPWTNAPFAPSPGLSGSKTVIGYYSRCVCRGGWGHTQNFVYESCFGLPHVSSFSYKL